MKNASPIRALCAQFLLVLLAGVTRVAIADPAGADAIVVTAVKGEVSVTSAGQARAVQKGTVLELPATIRTGAHSSLDLQQDRTTVSIAADTSVEIPATVSGPQLERIVQSSGNAFYSVGKRESKKLRVETPYLVAVIKGTQFNVAVQPDGATVSLFEGRLEVRAPDGSDVVDLNAGEIAVRQRNDRAIRVLRMDSGEAVRGSGANDGSAARSSDSGPTATHGDNASGSSRDATPAVPRPVLPLDGRIDVSAGGVDGDVRIDSLGTHAGVDVGSNSVKLSADVNVDAPVLPAAVDVTTDVGLDTGPGAVSVGADASVDVGVGSVDVGVDAGVDAGVDLGGGAVDLGVDTGVDAGVAGVDVGVDAGVDAGVDLGGGTVDLGTDLGVDTPVAGTDVDLSAGVDTGGVDVGADLGVGGIDLGVDLGVDLGAGGTTTTPPASEPPDSGGLLGGVLGRLSRRN